MAGTEQPDVPIWANGKARKQHDILSEVCKALERRDRERASLPIGKLTESDLEAEQLRLEELLHAGALTVDDFRRLREVDFFLQEMRERRTRPLSREEWKPESLGD